MGDRIELVGVALRTRGGEALEDLHRGVHPIDHRRDAELLVGRAALVVVHGLAMEARRETRLVARVRKQIAGELFQGEAIERQVAIERPDHPVAIGPDRAAVVLLVALAVGVAREVEPPSRPSLAEARRREQPIDRGFIGGVRRIGEERFDLVRSRRQPDQIERHPPQLRRRGRPGVRFESRQMQPRRDLEIDRLLKRTRSRLRLRRRERPVLAPRRAGVDPPSKEIDLLRGESPRMRLRRRHSKLGVLLEDPREDLAHLGVAGNDRDEAIAQIGSLTFDRVEAEPRLTRGLVRPVA